MRRTVHLLFSSLIVLSISFAPAKTYHLTEGETVMLYNALQNSRKAVVATSELSMQEGVATLKAIDSIQSVLIKQSQDTSKTKK